MYEELIRQYRDKAERHRIEGKPGLARDYINAADAIAVLLREVQKYRRQHPVIPAADVVEVVHASWVWNPDGMDWGIGAWVCGECKSRPETWWNTVKECHPLRCSGSRYCGNCGAKMDGGQDDV